MSFIIVYITADWKTATLALNCAHKEGSTKGEDLAAAMGARSRRQHGLRAVDGQDGSHVHGSRRVHTRWVHHPQAGVHHYVDSLERAWSEEAPMALARDLARRYTKSTQADGRLNEYCRIARVAPLKAVWDMETL